MQSDSNAARRSGLHADRRSICIILSTHIYVSSSGLADARTRRLRAVLHVLYRYDGPTRRALALARMPQQCTGRRCSMSVLQGRIPKILLGAVASSLPVAVANAEPDACIPREWTISVVDPDVFDADSYGARTSLFLDDAGRARIFYAKGPLNIDDWRVRSALQRSDSWRIQKLPANPGSPRPSV